MAVSAQRDGLRPITQQAIFALASLAYHDYEGPSLGLNRLDGSYAT